ncbi:hypothetical protein HK101_001782, partial [Irineochytrium annulatum]
YDMPKTIEDYVHRIGRTARAGNNGYVTSFFHKVFHPFYLAVRILFLANHLVEKDTNNDIAPDLVRLMTISGVPIPEFMQEFVAEEDTGAVEKEEVMEEADMEGPPPDQKDGGGDTFWNAGGGDGGDSGGGWGSDGRNAGNDGNAWGTGRGAANAADNNPFGDSAAESNGGNKEVAW